MKNLLISLFYILFSLPLIVAGADIDCLFVDDKGKPVVDAVVYALPVGSQTVPAPDDMVVELEQINKEFKPYVTIVQRGAKLSFPNRDSVAHHVYSFSEAKKFELPLYSGVSDPIVFEKAGVVTLGCNIHDWMKAYIVVVDTPFFVKSDSEGKAKLINLPDGQWNLEVWHPRLKGEVLKRQVTIDQAVLSEKFPLSLRREWKKPKGSAGEGLGY